MPFCNCFKLISPKIKNNLIKVCFVNKLYFIFVKKLFIMETQIELSEEEVLRISNEALDFVKENIGVGNNFNLIYDLKRENLILKEKIKQLKSK